MTNSLPGSPIVRSLAPADVDPIRRILEATGVFNEEERRVAVELVEQALRDPDGDYQVLVLSAGGDVIGYTCFGRAPFTDSVFDMYWVAVDPAWHGTGTARTLMAATEARIRERGGRLVLVETASKESYRRTRRFYEAMGYRETARIRDYYRTGDDKIVYEKRWD